MELLRNGSIADLAAAGATIRTAFCGPCFGAGDVPANKGLSIRHSTRNFPNREGSKPASGQIASVALMDARSIAATALNQGILTAATELDVSFTKPKYFFDGSIYEKRVYNGFGKAQPDAEIKRGPNIVDWPKMEPLKENLLLQVVSEIHDPVTTTDELIPSGETSSYRSNPLGLAEFTLSRKDPDYVGRAKAVQKPKKQEEMLDRANQALQAVFTDEAGKAAISPGRIDDLRDKAGRRFGQRTGGELPARSWRRSEYRPRIRDKALPFEPHQLGHDSLHRSGRAAV